MKKLFLIVLLSGMFTSSFAQEEKEEKDENKKKEKKGGFKKENLFTGGGLTVSFSSYSTFLGASPVFGYSINRWVDAGIIINFNYASNRHVTYQDAAGYYYSSDDKLRQTIYGPGIFARVYPIKFLFVQVQGELNFIDQKLIFDNGAPSQKHSASATSLLVGGGYCNGRAGSGDLFYYVSIMVDIAKNRDSPYLENTALGNLNVMPIIKAGLQIPLFRGKRRRGF